MTTPALIDDLKRDEGLRLTAYPDPLSGGAPWTIGWGHTGPEVHKGLTWTQVQAEAALERDIAHACGLLDQHIPWWRELDDVRQDVLANCCFNMGWLSADHRHGLGTFTHTLAAVKDHAWEAAGEGLLTSAWARQVGERAHRLANQMITGKHA